MATSQHWWLSNRKIVDKYMKDARALIETATREESDLVTALTLIDSALALSPRFDPALELKARTLLYLRRFKEVANLLQEYIPSYKMVSEESTCLSSDTEGLKLLSTDNNSCSSTPDSSDLDSSFKCFSISDLKKKLMSGICKHCENEGHWRYVVLGEACCHLGMMEDAIVLLQTGKRLSSAAFRRQSVCWSEDSFSLSNVNMNNTATPSETERVCKLITHIKLLLRRQAAAIAALDAGLYSEAIRRFSKILDTRRGTLQGFLAQCYVHRAEAFRASGRIAESIADCNRTLALDPTCLPALSTRASLFETIRCLPDCLHDLEHLKLLYDSILRDRKLPGPSWKRQHIKYQDVSSNLRGIVAKIQELKKRLGAREISNVDYYALIGLRRGCSRSELERAHLLICLRHRPDKGTQFIERCEFVDDRDLDTVKDQARMSALMLYRLVQKGYSNVMTTIMDEEAAEKQRQKAVVAALQATATAAAESAAAIQVPTLEPKQQEKLVQPIAQYHNKTSINSTDFAINCIDLQDKSNATATVFQGVFCREIAVVGNLLSQGGFTRQIPVNYGALSC